MPDIYEVDLFADDPYDVSALVMSRWLVPNEKESKFRDRLYLSLCSWFIRDRAARDPQWAKQPQMLIPNQACRSQDDLRRDLKTFNRRFKDRVTAGRMAVAFLQEAEQRTVPPLPPEVKRLSINELAGFVLEEHGIADPANLKSRVWRPSRPVAHLCAAWVTLAQEHFTAQGAVLNPIEAMRKREFLAQFLYRAELMEPLLDRSQLNISATDLIRFRLRPKGGVKKIELS